MPGWGEADVEVAVWAAQVEHAHPAQRLGRGVERQPVGRLGHPDPRVEIAQRGGQPGKVVRIAGRGDVHVFGRAGGAVLLGGEPADEHVLDVVPVQRGQDRASIQRPGFAHEAERSRAAKASAPVLARRARPGSAAASASSTSSWLS